MEIDVVEESLQSLRFVTQAAPLSLPIGIGRRQPVDIATPSGRIYWLECLSNDIKSKNDLAPYVVETRGRAMKLALSFRDLELVAQDY
ncbi:MAG TPA: hypothetical protein VHO06_00090 [Polyangia bacterium]|nr:hypothetical protein [Polyangia bacterium]